MTNENTTTMNNANTMRRVLTISGLVALLLMAFLFDFAITGLQARNASGAGYESILIVLFPLFELVIVAGGLGLFWYFLNNREQGSGIAIVFFVVGLLVLFATPLLFFLPMPDGWYNLIQYIQPGTFFFQAGGLIAGAGILGIGLKDKR